MDPKHVLLVIAVIVLIAIPVLSVGAFPQTALANGNSVIYTYDDAGRLTGVEYPNGATIDYTYDAMGNLLERNVASGEWSPWVYDDNPENGKIEFGEMSNAFHMNYLTGNISYSQIIEVLMCYLTSK